MKVEIRAGLRIAELRYNRLGEQVGSELFCRLDGRRDIHSQIPSRLEECWLLAADRYSAATSRGAIVPDCLVRSSMRPSRISSRCSSNSWTVRDPTSAWTLSMSFFCTSGVSTGEPRVFHQAVIGPENCWKKCSIPPGPPPR